MAVHHFRFIPVQSPWISFRLAGYKSLVAATAAADYL
jgi:hypothetical protein